ncbi:hypothetical protein HDU85_007462 [Gaertneriomyces sp. JEL0708]|nr:hypothetical protein HDU85_007462 [Gaertneriomyces sp. JEL0708]
MAQKVELEAWMNGCGAYADQNYDAALDAFSQIADTSRIHFNIAMCFIGLNAIDEAIQALTRSISCDPYLAVAYYMRGVCLYNSSALNDALQDFNDALTYLRGNAFIDYAQLGLAFKLHTCKVSFNRGLCLAAMGQVEAAVQDFSDAQRSMPSSSDNSSGGDLGQINQALNQPARAHQLFGPFSVPSDLIYAPPKGRVKNAEKRDYIGKAKVVAAVEATNNYAGFSGRELKAKTLPRSNTTGNMNTNGNNMTPASLNRGGGGLQPPGSVTLPRSYTTGDLRRPNPNLGRSNTLASGGGPGGGGRYPTIGRSGLGGGNGSSNGGAQRPLPQTLGRNSGGSSTFQRRAEPSVYAMDGLIDEFGGMDMNNNNGYSNNNNGYSNNNNNSYMPPQRSNPALNTFQRNNGPASNRSSYTASDTGSMTSYTGDKIKLKIHYTSTRIILLPSLSYSLLLLRIFGKFNIPAGQQASVVLKYRDEDGTLCELMDEEDLMVCVDGRGEVWVYLE